MGGKTAFDADAMRGTKLLKDLIDAKTGEAVATGYKDDTSHIA